MLTNLLKATEGRKTYLFLSIYIVVKLLQNHGVLGAMPDLEVVLLGGAGLALRDGIAKK